jgi:ATP-dependent Clp protease ATP-binding subunit ClpB
LEGLRHRLAERHITLELTPSAREFLAREGFDPIYGARPLKRTIQREVVQPLAARLLEGTFHDGDAIVLDVQQDQLTFQPKEHPGAPGAPGDAPKSAEPIPA